MGCRGARLFCIHADTETQGKPSPHPPQAKGQPRSAPNPLFGVMLLSAPIRELHLLLSPRRRTKALLGLVRTDPQHSVLLPWGWEWGTASLS